MKFNSGDYEKIYKGYQQFFTTESGKDLIEFLNGQREKAMKVLKKEDSPVERAKWQLVDTFYERLKFLEKEMIRVQKEK